MYVGFSDGKLPFSTFVLSWAQNFSHQFQVRRANHDTTLLSKFTTPYFRKPNCLCSDSAVALISVGKGAQAQIAFSSDRGGDFDIYVMDEDGSNVIQLTDHPHTDFTPAWSPDGKRIAFNSLRDDPQNVDRNWEIYVDGREWW